MVAPLFSAEDYLGALQGLMPRGRVWPRDRGAVQTKILAGLTRSYALQNERSNYLLADAFPSSALELLPEWEASLGLPLPAAGPEPTVTARRALVLARLIGIDGVSEESFAHYAGLLGYEITVRGHAPFRCGQSHCGEVLGGVERMFEWTIEALPLPGMPFGAYGPAVLREELQRLAPPFAFLNIIFK